MPATDVPERLILAKFPCPWHLGRPPFDSDSAAISRASELRDLALFPTESLAWPLYTNFWQSLATYPYRGIAILAYRYCICPCLTLLPEGAVTLSSWLVEGAWEVSAA